MAWFRSRAPRSVAQTLVREVHLTVLQTLAYVALFVALGFGALEFCTSPDFDRAVAKLVSSPGLSTRADWVAAKQEPALRGPQ